MMELIQQFHWRPEIGDPTPMGWMTAFAYALTALTAYAAARRAGRAPGLPRGSRIIWLLVMIPMAFLALHKQLDLQSLLAEVCRILSLKLGWHEHQHELRKWFVIGLITAPALGALATLIFCRGFWKQHVMLLSGLFLVLTCILLRAASTGRISPIIGRHLENPRTGGLLETGGIALILLAALIDWRNPSKAAKPPWKPAA